MLLEKRSQERDECEIYKFTQCFFLCWYITDILSGIESLNPFEKFCL